MTTESRLLDVKAVAVRYGVSPWSVYRWIRRGQLAALKVGGLLRIRPAALRQFEHRARGPAAGPAAPRKGRADA